MPVVEDDYNDPPDIEPRQCGGCLMFMTDPPLPSVGAEWGRCTLRNISVTRQMQVVLKRNEPTCYMEKPS